LLALRRRIFSPRKPPRRRRESDSGNHQSTVRLLTPPSDNATLRHQLPPQPHHDYDDNNDRAKQVSRKELARIQQQGIIRRQKLLFKSNEALAAGQKAELAKQYPLAGKSICSRGRL